MNKFEILVLVCFASGCAEMNTQEVLDSSEEVQEIIIGTMKRLTFFFVHFIEDKEMLKEDMVAIIEARAEKILHEKNVQPKIVNMVDWFTYVSLLRLGGFHIFKKYKDFAKVDTTITTKSEARALLRMTVDLRTLLPMRRMHEEANRRTTTHFLSPKNVLKLIRCFILLTDEGIERVSKLDMHEKFIESTFPYWLQTFVDLVREDARLKSEFERLIDAEEETGLFVIPPSGERLSVPIVESIVGVYQLRNLSALEDKNYLRLRAMIHVANEGNAEADKLHQIFQVALRAVMDHLYHTNTDTVESLIFRKILRKIEGDPLLWERIQDAEGEYDTTNAMKVPFFHLAT